MGGDVTVVTAITDGYDTLKEPAPDALSKRCRYVCFTDGPAGDNGAWSMVKFPHCLDELGPVRKVRYVKTHLWELLPGCKFRFWVDGTITVASDLSLLVDKVAEPGKYLYPMRHWGWDCLYEEARQMKRRHPEKCAKVDEQIAHYREIGVPEHLGYMAENNVRLETDSEYVSLFMLKWWREIEEWSARDQISFPYVLWRNDPGQAGVKWLPANLYHSKWLSITKYGRHASGKRVKENWK